MFLDYNYLLLCSRLFEFCTPKHTLCCSNMHLKSSLNRNAIELLEAELKASSKELILNDACAVSTPEFVKRLDSHIVSARHSNNKFS